MEANKDVIMIDGKRMSVEDLKVSRFVYYVDKQQKILWRGNLYFQYFK